MVVIVLLAIEHTILPYEQLEGHQIYFTCVNMLFADILFFVWDERNLFQL